MARISFHPSGAAAVRRQRTNTERQKAAAERDMTPGTPHPNPRLAARGWVASKHGTYVRQRDAEHEAG